MTLGNPRLHAARKNAVDALKAEADRYAANVLPIIGEAEKAVTLWSRGSQSRVFRERGGALCKLCF